MKILYAKFENFSGFYTGMNLKTFELDFERYASNTPVTMVFGKNRSGKSCLISMLQPFPGTNDNRKNIILDGENGKKTLIFLREDGKKFKTEINYIRDPKDKEKLSEKCFFYVEEDGAWKNINPSGRIRTYQDCVFEHLKVTEDYFTVGRIGGISNFIDLSKSDRKKYIANFLPDIDPYLKIHKTASEKITFYKKQMASLSDELIKLSPEATCAVNISKYTQLIEQDRNDLDKENTNYGVYKGKIDTILSENESKIPELRDYARTGKNPLIEKASFLETKIKGMEESIPEGCTKETIAEVTATKESELAELNVKRSVLITEKDNARRNMISAEEEKNQAESELTAMEDKEKEYENQKKVYDERKESLEKTKVYLEKFTHPKFKHFSTYDARSLEILNRDSKDCYTILMNIKNAAREADAVGFDFFDNESLRKAVFDATNRIKQIEKAKEKIANSKTEIPLLEKQAKLEAVLDKRPSNCVNDNCPFIASAMEAKGSRARLEAIRMYLESPEARAAMSTDIQTEYDFNLRRKQFLEDFGKTYAEFKNKAKGFLSLRNISKIQDIIEDAERFVTLINGNDTEIFNAFDVSDIEDYVNANINYSAERQKLELAVAGMNNMKNVKEFVTNLRTKFNKADEKYSSYKTEFETKSEEFDTNETKIEEVQREISNLNLASKALENIDAKKSELATIKEKIALMEKYVSDIEENRSNMIDSGNKIKELKSLIESNETELEKYTYQSKRRKEIEEKLEGIQNTYKTIDIVKTATDVVKGIPVFLIDSYLEDIRIRANHLLDLTFNGNFQMDKFVITEKEFSIPVIKGDGSRLDDALEGSGAEISFIKESLSFAIIEKAISGYNIVSLDEVDGVLDEANRIGFIRMLKKQIADLKLEQVFIISHNREFLDEEANMILLKDHGIETENTLLMQNKNIIFNFHG